jgi:predicted dehydrogenase
MKKVGIIGAGQAGQRIAIALSTFPDVRVAGIVDPRNGREILTNTESLWRVPDVKFFDSDEEMLAEGYDAIVIAADPINVSYEPLGQDRKMVMLSQNNVTCPILWERPLGFLPEHPARIFDTVPSKAQSIISFGRYGLPSKISRTFIKSGSLGQVTDFEFFLTLNCDLGEKKWRHAGDTGVTQPVHFLDNAFEQIEIMELGKISSISAVRSDSTKKGITFDEKWEISISLSNGLTGRVIGLQYLGDMEFLYGLRSLRIVGTSGAILSSMGQTRFIDQLGDEHGISLASFGIDPRIVPATKRLERFFKNVDGYPDRTPCRGEAQALVECLRTWVDSLSSRKKLSSFNLTTKDQATRYLALADAAVKSAAAGECVNTIELYR